MVALELLLELLVAAPYTACLLFFGAAFGWLMFGMVGLIMGGAIGTVGGLSLDFSANVLVKRHRLKLTILGFASLIAFAIWYAQNL